MSKEVLKLNGRMTIVISNPFFINAAERCHTQGSLIDLRRRHPVKGRKFIGKSIKLLWLEQDIWIFDLLGVTFVDPSSLEKSSVFFCFAKVPTFFRSSTTAALNSGNRGSSIGT
jgi:hypothetical protein